MSMCDNGVTAIIPPVAELEKIKIEPNEILLIKIDTNRYDLADASCIYQDIVQHLPEGICAMGIPTGIEIEPVIIDEMIKRLEECKDGILH